MSTNEISANAIKVLERRYLARDENGEVVESVEQLFWRVAMAVASADKRFNTEAVQSKTSTKATAESFFQMMTELRFLPNSPTLMNAGRPLGQLSACFVLPIEDSMEAIFEAVKNAALIHKSGGGTGFSFSRLRPHGSTVNSTGGVASGPVSFMRVFNMATEAVKQGGTRRGANMGILRIDHPDILEFIDCKKNNADITNFNISVGITEAFMQAVEADENYDLVDPHTKIVVEELSARAVFDRIVMAAWSNGEPGIVFLDRLNRDNVVPTAGEIEATNPCGEQPLLPYESCNLGSINLVKMVKASGANAGEAVDAASGAGVATSAGGVASEDGATSADRAATSEPGAEVAADRTSSAYQIDWPLLAKTVDEAVHFLDNVIEINNYPLQSISETTLSTRKIGLGVMGFADMLLLLGIPYNSEAAIELAKRLMSFITTEARAASQRLATIRGSFPLFDVSIYKDGAPLRNATATTIAPTGTLSIIAGCSSGVEPVFAYAYIRTIMDGTEMVEVSPILRAELERRGIYSEELMRKIVEAGSIAHIEELPGDLREVYVCAHDVSPEYHIRIQAAFQEFTDNAVSKTVNFPSSATPDEVAEVYRLAYSQGCKGVTIYRDGSRDGQVLSTGSQTQGAGSAEAGGAEGAAGAAGVGAAGAVAGGAAVSAAADGAVHGQGTSSTDLSLSPEFGHIRPRPRPEITQGFTERMKIGCGNLYVTVNFDENGICEVFTSTGKAGGCPSQSEATARLASVALRSGMSVSEVCTQLKGIRCPSTVRQGGMSCTSCPDAIAKVVLKVSKHIEAGKAATAAAIKPEPVLPGKKGQLTSVGQNAGKDTEHQGPTVRDDYSSQSPYLGYDSAAAEAGAEVSAELGTPLASSALTDQSAPAVPLAPSAPAAPVAPAADRSIAATTHCPECGSGVEHEGGCVICRQCGYSKCG